MAKTDLGTSQGTEMRTYERTHPWIDFTLDLRSASHRLWLLLGEAQAKCRYLAGIPLMPAVAKDLYRIFLAKGVLATTAIEGNTLTEEEVLLRIDGKLDLPPSKQYLGQEIDNIVAACNLIAEGILTQTSHDTCLEDIKEYNRLALKELPLPDEVSPGEIRRHDVVVGSYKGAPPEDCEYLTDKLCAWLNAEFKPEPRMEIAFGILRAIVAHVYLACIHPFADGNGRTARLLEFRILLSVGVPATAAHLLSNHYNQTRADYYRSLEVTHKVPAGVLRFIEYALQGLVDGLDQQIVAVRQQQMLVHWINYVYEQFPGKPSPADVRRRNLLLDLSEKADPVPISKIRLVSPRVAEAYASKGQKTITRDINKLQKMHLIERTPKGIRARSEIMLAFLPPSTQLGDAA